MNYSGLSTTIGGEIIEYEDILAIKEGNVSSYLDKCPVKPQGVQGQPDLDYYPSLDRPIK